MGRINLGAILSRRETQIAELLSWGASKKEVADRLSISTRTVENTARNIYQKIGIQKATELCVYWFCAKCGVSPDLDPLKRALIAMILLTAICNYEWQAARQQQHDNILRPTAARTMRTSRGRRTDQNIFNPDFTA